MVNKFRHFQQNEQSLFTSNRWTYKRPHHVTLEIHVLAKDGHNNMAGLNR